MFRKPTAKSNRKSITLKAWWSCLRKQIFIGRVKGSLKLEEKYTVQDEKLGDNSSQTHMYTYCKSSNYNDSLHLHKLREPYQATSKHRKIWSSWQ